MAGVVLAAIVLAGAAPTALAGPLAGRCAPGSTPLLVGKRALLVRRASQGDRAELSACRRGSHRAVGLGATYGDGLSTNARAHSTLTGAAIGGSVVAAGFEILINGCLYAHGCGDAPRQVLRIADTSALTLRRIPLRGTLNDVSVAADGRTTFRVDEFACTSTYRTAPAPGSAIDLLSRVPTRVSGTDAVRLCGAD